MTMMMPEQYEMRRNSIIVGLVAAAAGSLAILSSIEQDTRLIPPAHQNAIVGSAAQLCINLSQIHFRRAPDNTTRSAFMLTSDCKPKPGKTGKIAFENQKSGEAACQSTAEFLADSYNESSDRKIALKFVTAKDNRQATKVHVTGYDLKTEYKEYFDLPFSDTRLHMPFLDHTETFTEPGVVETQYAGELVCDATYAPVLTV